MSNKLKLLKRMAYGFRDQDFFMSSILWLHQTRLGRTFLAHLPSLLAAGRLDRLQSSPSAA